jgi:hypothetical protein
MSATSSRSLLGKSKKTIPVKTKFSFLEALKEFFKSNYCKSDILELLPKEKTDIPTVLTLTLK